MTDPVMGTGKEILLNDTIGFMRDLPPQLFQAFASTLEDSIHSDILLHVIDCADPERSKKIQIVEDILQHIQANQKIIYVFNKVDRISKEAKHKQQLHRIQKHKQKQEEQQYDKELPPHVYVSAHTNT